MYTPVRPSTRCRRPASLPRRSSLPAGSRSRPTTKSTDSSRRSQKGGRQGERERRLAVAGPELEATLEEDWPGRNLVWWACGRRDGAQPSSTVAVNNSCQAPDEIKRMACFARGRLLQTQGLLFKTATSRL